MPTPEQRLSKTGAHLDYVSFSYILISSVRLHGKQVTFGSTTHCQNYETISFLRTFPQKNNKRRRTCFKQDTDGTQNMSGVYLLGLIFIKLKQL